MTLPKFGLYLSVLTAILWGILLFIKTQFLADYLFFFDDYQVFVFLWASTFIIYAGLRFVNTHFFDKTGYAFLGFGIIKMAFALIFLWPMIKGNHPDVTYDTLLFFGLYFCYLFFETFTSISLLNGK